MKKLLLQVGLITVTAAASQTAYAQNPGDVDVNFGASGYTLTDHVSNTGERYWNSITLADDKIVMVGHTTGANSNILVSKFKADGTVDSTFAVNGIYEADLSIGADEEAYGIVELPDGKFLVTGYTIVPGGADGFILRLNADGTTDNSFGTSAINGVTLFNGGQGNNAYGMDISLVGSSIIVGGNVVGNNGDWDWALFKFTMGGGANVNFGTNGVEVIDFGMGHDRLNAIEVDGNGSIVIGGSLTDAAGENGAVGRRISDGSIDASFNTIGVNTFNDGGTDNVIWDVAVTTGNKVYAVGYQGTDPNMDGVIFRYNTDGTLDNTFGTNGKQVSDIGTSNGIYLYGIELLAGNNIVVAGHAKGLSVNNEPYALMLDDTGSPVTNFGGGDVYVSMPISVNTLNGYALSVQSDGGIILGGYLTSQDFVGENMFMVRLLPLVDESGIEEVSDLNMVFYPNPATTVFSIASDVQPELVELVALNGSVVSSWPAANEYHLPVNLVPGTYIVKAHTSQGLVVRKLMVTK